MTNLLPRIEFLMQALVRTRLDCPQCRTENSRIVAHKNVVVRVRRCDDCGLAFTDPTYARSSFYDRAYGAEGSTTEMPEPSALTELMRDAFRGTDKDFHARLDVLSAIAPGDRLLEVGSSWGYFLHQAEAHGFDATGVELSDTRRAYGVDALGRRMVASLDAADELEEASFDVVYSAHTLEHFTDLAGVLPRLRALLRPGGLLALEVPNFDLDQFGRRVLSNIGAVHPLGFDSAFFARNLPAAGFEDVRLFERWEDVPASPVARCRGDVVVALARRPLGVRASEG